MVERQIAAVVLGSLALQGIATLAQQAPAPPTASGAISGIVVDAVTNSPLAGARVSLGRTDDRSAATQVVTDPKGRFVFQHLPAAKTYYLGADRFGYAYTRYGGAGPGALRDIATIALDDDQWVDAIEIPLWRYGSLSGRVTDERNEPVVGVAVRAFTVRTIAGRPQPVSGPLTTTDDRGMYRLGGLEPSAYIVSVLSVQSTALASTPEARSGQPVGSLAPVGITGGRGAFVASPGVDVDGRHRLVITNFATPPPPSSSEPRAYPATFYPAALRPGDAQAIAVEYGDVRTGIDMVIVPVPAVRVSGRVDGLIGAAPNLLLRLLPTGSESLGFGAEAATTQLEKDGTFTFLNVPAGDYTLLAQSSVMDFTTSSAHIRLDDAPGFPGRSAAVGSMRGVPGLSYLSREGETTGYWGRATVSVGSRALDNLVVPLHRSATVSGRFVFADDTPPPTGPYGMEVTLEPIDGSASLGRPIGRRLGDDPTFAFTVEGLLGGTYRLSNRWFDYGVVSVIADGRDVTYIGFDGSLGRDFDDVVVTVTSKRPVFSGVVRGDQGPAMASVIVFPADRERWVDTGWNPPWAPSVQAGSDGAFTVGTLPQGDYLVIAVDQEFKDEWANPKFLAAAAALATPVSLRWGEAKSLDLQLKEVTVR